MLSQSVILYVREESVDWYFTCIDGTYIHYCPLLSQESTNSHELPYDRSVYVRKSDFFVPQLHDSDYESNDFPVDVFSTDTLYLI